MVVEEKMTFEDYLKTIESELYEAIAALEGEDLDERRYEVQKLAPRLQDGTVQSISQLGYGTITPQQISHAAGAVAKNQITAASKGPPIKAVRSISLSRSVT